MDELSDAVERNDYRKASQLVKQGKGDLDQALDIAVSINSLKLARLLLDYGANPNAQNPANSNRSLLMINSSYKMKKLLLDYGADVNHQDDDGNTPLYYIQMNDIETLKLLLEYGADVNQLNHEGPTIFMSDISLKEMQLYFDYGADLTIQDDDGLNVLMINKEDGEMVKWVLDHGADVNQLNEEGENVLHMILNSPLPTTQKMEIILILLSHGVDPNYPNRNGKTPLLQEVSEIQIPIVKLLLEYGAGDVDEALQYTIENRQGEDLDEWKEMQMILIQHGAELGRVLQKVYKDEFIQEKERKMSISKVYQSLEKSNPALAEPRLRKSIQRYIRD